MTLPSGVVTFLLTDIEGSTALWDANPVGMAAALERHDALVGEIVAAHGGTLLKAKGEGDATLSVFQRASEAAAAALAVQRAFGCEAWPGGVEVRVRMAIHAGEAHERDGDYFGPTLNRAARLRALAGGGEVFCSQATAELIHDRLPPDAELCELGRQVLRGISRPEHVYGLWVRGLGSRPAPLPANEHGHAPVTLDVPAPLRVHAESPFVGRDQELGRLLALWAEAREGVRRAVVVGGEPGVGKTRLVAEAAARAHRDGALVLYGRCDEDLGVPYQPFVEALGPYLDAAPAELLRAQAGRGAGELSRLPGVGARLRGLAPPTQGEAETERYLLFEAVADLLSRMAEATPAVVVLDDLHWASAPTLLLLRHLLKRTDVPILMVATYRDTELDRTHPLSEVLTDLRRESRIERISLEGLDAAGVYAYLQGTAGEAELDPGARELAKALWQETDGNPFFVGEVLAHLVETGALSEEEGHWTATDGLSSADLGLPEGVKEVIGRRLSRLSPEANRALTVASVVGPSFSLRLLEQTTDVDPDALLVALEEATSTGLVRESGPGTYTFAHALIRQTLYSELSGSRRMRLHRRVGEALESAPHPERHVEALAYHFAEAALDGCVDKAADYALAAGQRALDRLASEEAMAIAERALAVLELEPSADPRHEILLVLLLAESLPAAGGAYRGGIPDVHRQKELALRAAQLAREASLADLLARAALSAGDPVGQADPAVIELLEEALGATSQDDAEARSLLLSHLAQYRAYAGAEGTGVDDLAAEALELARRSGSIAALAYALYNRNFTLFGSPEVRLRLSLAEELLELGRQSGDRYWTLMGADWCATAHLELGDVEAFLEHVEKHRRVGGGSDAGASRAFDVLVCLLQGRFDEAEALAEAWLATAAADNADVLNVYAGWLVQLRHEQGRSAELVPLVEAAVADNPDIPAFRAALARCYTDGGDFEGARPHFDALAAGDFALLRRDMTWTATLAILAEVCAVIGDATRARVLYELLVPHAGHVTLVQGAELCMGAVDRYLGMLAATFGSVDHAARHYRAALEVEERLDSVPNLARTRLWYARLLLSRAGPGDRALARELIDLALQTAEELGMAGVACDARRLASEDL